MHPRLGALRSLAALVAIVLLAVACGNGDEQESTAQEPTPPARDEEQPSSIGATGGLELEDSRGSVALDGPAARVVALEWSYAEDLLALGVQPVGMADIAGYGDWVNVKPQLEPDVADVGTRQEPSLESIAALNPDLIITDADRHADIVEQFEQIAPTLLFNPYPAPDEGVTEYERMVESFQTIASAVDREEEAETVLADLDAHLAEAANRISSADPPTEEVVIAQGFSQEQVPTIRMFLDTSMAVGVLQRLGLENAWNGEPEQYGFNTVDVEALTTVEDASFLYVAQEDDDIFAGALADNAVWQDLTFVEEGRVHPVGGDTWLFGGPLSAEVVADRVVERLASS